MSKMIGDVESFVIMSRAQGSLRKGLAGAGGCGGPEWTTRGLAGAPGGLWGWLVLVGGGEG